VISQTTWLYAGGIAGITFVARVWARYKMERRGNSEDALPLFDPTELERATVPEQGDDTDVLAELYSTLSVLNRRRFAPEFWSLDEQLVKYYRGLPLDCQPTLRRAVVRLIETDDRWLQTAGVKTAVALEFKEAVPAIESLVAQTTGPAEDAAVERFQQTLRDAAVTLRAV
jgi:hypothetical protein